MDKQELGLTDVPKDKDAFGKFIHTILYGTPDEDYIYCTPEHEAERLEKIKVFWENPEYQNFSKQQPEKVKDIEDSIEALIAKKDSFDIGVQLSRLRELQDALDRIRNMKPTLKLALPGRGTCSIEFLTDGGNHTLSFHIIWNETPADFSNCHKDWYTHQIFVLKEPRSLGIRFWVRETGQIINVFDLVIDKQVPDKLWTLELEAISTQLAINLDEIITELVAQKAEFLAL